MPPETEIIQDTAIQLIAKASLVNINSNREQLEKLAETYKGIKIAGIEDKENYKLLKKGVGELRTARTSIEKLRKAEKSNILQAGKLLDEAADGLTSIVSTVEKDTIAEVARIDTLIEEAEAKRREELENKKQARISLLFETGLTFSGTHYKIGELSITPMQVAEYSEAQFEGFIAQANVEFEALQMAKQEEEERLEQERLETKRKQQEAELQAEQEREKAAQLQRQADEMLNERTEGRLSNLATLGFNIANNTNGGYYGAGNYFISASSIKTATKEQWSEEIVEYIKHKNQHEKEIAEFDEMTKAVVETPVTPTPSKGFQHPPGPDPIGDPRILQLSRMGFKYVSEADAFIKNGVQVKMIAIQTKTEEGWKELLLEIEELVNGNERIIDHELSNQAEKQAAYFDTRPYQATLMFNTERPYMDTKLGKATLRIYVEEFLEQANEGIAPNTVIESGTLGDSPDLLFLLLKL